MVLSGSLQLSHQLGLCKDPGYNIKFKSGTGRGNVCPFYTTLSSRVSFHCQNSRSIYLLGNTYRPRHTLPCRDSVFKCHSFLGPGQPLVLPKLKAASQALVRSYNALQGSPFVLKLIPAVGLIIFAVWGLAPVMRLSRNITFRKSDSSWKKSNTHYIMSSYLQPLLLWMGAILICRALDPIVLPTEASQVVKQRLLNFVRSLSTVLAIAYCLSSLIQQAQKFFMETNESNDTRNMGFQFAGKAIYSAVWVAAVSLFMELLGFSTQRWLTAGGLGTVLLTLAGREIFTNFLSSAMIHATRPFVVNEWIQTKIEGYEVSGTVEHVGWWSPTIIRGEDREAVHIPNHKFTVNVVRNLSQKTHWRIKTHLAISHLDAHKINNIVADMRKVLAKNPQVEQQRLHRRVFFDNINPENQALLILVSCFVKTSHHEEYLCVKEAILLDLLRVISHHRARLATPIRTVQKIFSDADLENVPFADSIYNQGVTSKRPFLLEPPYKINGEDKTKGRSLRTNGERDGKTTIRPASDSKTDTKDGTISVSDSKIKETQSDVQSDVKKKETSKPQNMDSKAAFSSVSDPKKSEVMVKETLQSDSKMNNKATEVSDAGSNYEQTSSASDSSNQKTDSTQSKKSNLAGNVSQSSFNSPHISSEIGAEKADEFSTSSQVKQGERMPAPQSSTSRPVLEDNIVLGVALEGSKRTLPIEEEMAASSLADETELASCQNGQGFQSADWNKKNGKNPASPSSTSIDP